MAARSGGKELAGLTPQQLFNRLYRSGLLDRFASAQTSFPLIRPSPAFFSSLSPIGRTGLRASVIPNGNSVFKRYPRCSTHKQHLSGPRIECGVTQKKRRRCYRAELVAGCAIVGGCGTRHRLRHSSSSIHLWLARSLPDKGGVLRLFYLSSCGAWQLYFLYS